MTEEKGTTSKEGQGVNEAKSRKPKRTKKPLSN